MSSLIKIVSIIISAFFCAAFAAGAEVQIKTGDYNIYKGDLDGDGDGDFYFSQKPFFIILHGDIATPLLIPGNTNYAVYNNAGIYQDAVSFSLSSDALASRIATGSLKFAVWNVDVFMGLDGNSVSIPNKSAGSSGAPTITYTYDALGRLTFVTDSTNGNRDYDYDRAGNRLLVSTNVASDTTTEPAKLSAPTNLYKTLIYSCAWKATWNPVAGAARYLVKDTNGASQYVAVTEAVVACTVGNSSSNMPQSVQACDIGNICGTKANFN